MLRIDVTAGGSRYIKLSDNNCRLYITGIGVGRKSKSIRYQCNIRVLDAGGCGCILRRLCNAEKRRRCGVPCDGGIR